MTDLEKLRAKVAARMDEADKKIVDYQNALRWVFSEDQARAVYSIMSYSLCQDEGILELIDAIIAKETPDAD